ncbi:MAG: hypothetical protein HXX11_05860 [Desulfuromonadales bacterium]|nr:hypothetical protein [Desulfuromonadales bacterium]
MKQKIKVHEQPKKWAREERRMAYSIGYDHMSSSYPHEEMDFLPRITTWTCCNMVLPTSFYLCPICGLEQGMDDEDALMYFD